MQDGGKRSGRDDLNPAELIQYEEVLVAGYNEISMSSNGQTQKHGIVRTPT